MAYQYYADCNGDTIKVYEDDGRLIHAPRPWNALMQLKSREDDVIVCTYPRSGTHWVWEIVRMLQTGDTELTALDMKSSHLIVAEPSDIVNQPSPRVLAVHRQFHDLPSDFIINRRKLVLVLRDPRDVCVSFYQLTLNAGVLEYKGNFDGYVDLFLRGKVPFNTWSRWVLSYEKGVKEHPELPVHVIRYEQLKQDPVKEIGRLAEFLGVDPSVANRVAEKTKFSAMQKYKTQFGEDPVKDLFDGETANKHIFRKGESGGWKEWFNEEQAKHFTDTLCQQLGRSSIQPLL